MYTYTEAIYVNLDPHKMDTFGEYLIWTKVFLNPLFLDYNAELDSF